MTVTPQTSTIPPMPGDHTDDQRRSSARQRIRLLDGGWLDDLIRHLTEHFVDLRASAVGKPDLSINLYLAVIDQLSQLYATRPIVDVEGASDELMDSITETLADAGLWSMTQENQRYTLAIREGFVRPSVSDDGTLVYRLVTPDAVIATASPATPDMPWRLVEALQRDVPNARGKVESVWTWDEMDISDPRDPTYRILRADSDMDRAEDITEIVTGVPSLSGPAYPYRWTQGERAGLPYIPHAMYHAKRTGKLWNWRTGLEAVEGALTVAVLHSFWLHNVKDCSWSQKYSIDAAVRGLATEGPDGLRRQTVITDPASILMFDSEGDHPEVSTLAPAIDPKTLGEAIASYQQDVGVYLGLGPDDYERSGQAESGYAISLKRESVREKQRGYEPTFRRGDTELLEKTAAMMNAGGANPPWPEEGWSIEYPGLPRTGSEVQVGLERLEKLEALGLASKVDGYMELHPGVTREKALEDLRRIKQETRTLAIE